mmetsp:Transcript_36126/g.78838  ORF Transcript_36126/g.78838 Transcript_36126/m.78838 type:complete len:207 (-) Transcript_36126:198-818(-)
MNANAEKAPRKTVSWLYLIPIKAAMKNVRSPTSMTRITRKLRINPFQKPKSAPPGADSSSGPAMVTLAPGPNAASTRPDGPSAGPDASAGKTSAGSAATASASSGETASTSVEMISSADGEAAIASSSSEGGVFVSDAESITSSVKLSSCTRPRMRASATGLNTKSASMLYTTKRMEQCRFAPIFPHIAPNLCEANACSLETKAEP